MRAFASKLGEIFQGAISPVTALLGAGLISYGTYLISHPAGFIVGGALLIAVAVDSRL
jgi:hypothetical protein